MILADLLLAGVQWWVAGAAVALAAVSVRAAFGGPLPRGLPRTLLPRPRRSLQPPQD